MTTRKSTATKAKDEPTPQRGDGDGKGKSSEDLEKEAHERGLANQEAAREAQIEKAKARVEEAQSRLDEAQADLDTLEGKKGARPTREGGSSTLPPGEDLEDHQIAHGQAPIAEGEFEPVDPEKAAAAKSNRGRGLGG